MDLLQGAMPDGTSLDAYSNAIRSFGQSQAQAPSVAGVGAGSVGSGLGFNVGTGQLLLGGLQTIGSLWNAFESRKLAKEQLAFTKEITNANLNNQIKAYNTTLADRGRSRAYTEGQDSATAQAYIDNNKLSR